MYSAFGADRALKEIIAYRDGLDARNERDLVLALDRVVDVVQNHLYHAYLAMKWHTDLFTGSASGEKGESLVQRDSDFPSN
ncbi:hypothetical protein ACTXT7_001457 [Hymenolepis weldensis]